MNRISYGMLNNQSVSYLSQNMGILSRLQEKLASGKNINRASDDPVGLTRLLSLTNTINSDARYTKNVDAAIAETNTADTALSNLVSLVQRAQTLTTQAATATNSQEGRNAIAQEISQIIDQMVQVGNTEVGGKYIFAGFKSGSPPFARTGAHTIVYNGTPSSQPWQRQTEIATGVNLTININGGDLLGSAAGTAGPLPVTVTGSGIFQTMTALLMDLQAAGDPQQLDEIRNRLDNLSANLSSISAQQATIGSISNRLDQTKERIEQRTNVLSQQYANLQNIDSAKVIADLNYQENVFQASLSVTARVLQTSLMDFIR